jgi:hypothetical protein
LKQGDALPPFIFSLALEYAIRKAQENWEPLKRNGTHQLLVYADRGNLLVGNTEAKLGASKVVGLEVNAEEAKYLLTSHHQNAGENHNTKTTNRISENVAQFKHYLDTTPLPNKNCILALCH